MKCEIKYAVNAGKEFITSDIKQKPRYVIFQILVCILFGIVLVTKYPNYMLFVEGILIFILYAMAFNECKKKPNL